MERWTLQPIFDSYLLAFGLAGLLLLLLFVRPVFSTPNPFRQRVLTGMRLMVILLVVLAMLRPTWIWKEIKTQSATILLLLDQSRSMSTPDMGGVSRWQALRAMMEKAKPKFAQLAESYELQTYVYDSRAINVPPREDSGWELPAQPTGDLTDLGTSLDDVLRAESGKRLAAVFVIGDGAQRVTEPTIDIQQPVRELARRNEPLYAISLGESRDKSQSRDVAVENMPDQYTVFVNNELELEASVRVEGYAGRQIPVHLRVDGPDGKTEYVGPIQAIADQSNQQLRVNLSYIPKAKGQYKLTLKAEVQPGEQVTENNELSAYLNVLDGGLRVLYVDGNIGWPERKFIRRVIDESPDMQVDLFLDTRKNKSEPMDLPVDDLSSYDVFVLGDVDSQSLGPESAFAITSLVGDGKGLIMLGGVQSFGPGGYAGSTLGEALPVKMDRLKRQSMDEPIRPDVHLRGELKLRPAKDHFVTRITAPQENDRLWKSLPALQGANRFRELTEQASVLLSAEHEGRTVPILVESKYGLGRVLAMAGDSTYRWYRYGNQTEHKRFWRQIMLWLASKDDARQDEVWLKMAQRRFAEGSKVPFTTGVYDKSGTAVEGVEFKVELHGPAGFFRKIRITPEGDHFKGSSPELSAQGEYEYQVTATRDGKEVGQTQGNFLILNQDLEMSDPAANPQLMSSLAELTSEAGGRLILPEEWNSVLDEISLQRLEDEVVFESKWQLADTTTGAGIYFGLLAVLLVIEWFLRKSWGLV